MRTSQARPIHAPRFLSAALLIFFSAVVPAFSQAGTGSIHGQVTDPSGRSIPDAAVSFTPDHGSSRSVKTDVQGQYQLRNLNPGPYTIRVTAKGFAPAERDAYDVTAGAAQVLDFPLYLASATEKVTVQDSLQLEVDPSNNASALVIRGKELDALSDDRDDLAADLAALAGPAAGPNGGQIYIDGFTGGRLPPKSSIREVRINQNPFSAQYDRIGMGRVEIFTKPGSEDYHGEVQFHYGNDIFNSRNPFTPEKPPYERRQWEGEFGGPLGRKTSFFADFELRHVTENAFVNARTLDDNLQVISIAQGIVTPRRSTEENVKLDHQLSKNHTLTLRYTFARDSTDNQGAGGFSLPSRIYNNRDSEDTAQFVETGVYGAHTVNETRARYSRQHSRQNGNAGLPTTVVLDAFTGGGPPLTLSFTNQDRLEIQNTTTVTHGPHLLRWGGRLRGIYLKDQDTQNYTGTFTFSSLDSYRLTLLGQRAGLSPQQIRATGGGPSQFSLAAGDPLASLNQFDLGFFFLDDWRARPNLTLSLGLRYESQTHLGDHRDVAPRVGIAWGLGPAGKAPKTVIRGGAGLFYDRVGESLSLDALRRDGIHQQQFVSDSPDFYPAIPSIAQLLGNRSPQAIRELDARMRAPRLAQIGVGIERQLPKNIVASVNYLHTRGWHNLRSRNITAPLTAAQPAGTAIYLYEASGVFQQNQLIASVNARVSPKLSFTGSYTLNKANSDTDGAGTFAADPYNLRSEYGRAGFDIRHRVQLNGVYSAPWGIRLSPFLIAASGRPFNITVGRDLNRDTIFADRPAFATDLNRASVIRTPFGAFDLAPLPGQPLIPRNYGNGPGQVSVNLRAAKIFKFGEGGKGKRDPMELTISGQARNLLNHPNLASPVGNLSSSVFGQSLALVGGGGGNSASGNRRIELQIKLAF
ncbi:MAG: Cna protein B-type domain protein [Candidatus Solibacter sp.]|nr:Cna protein B-type domain protein [Candidatus Solibacter sp.]